MSTNERDGIDTEASRVYRNEGNRALLEALPTRLGRLLDLGCGAGDNVRRLAGRFDAAIGVTRSPAEARIAAPHFTQVLTIDLDAPLPDDLGGPFDVVLASHVLEHLRAPELLLQRLHAHLRPGAIVAVALPNLMHYASRLRLLGGRFDYTESGLMDRTHLRWFTFESAGKLLEEAGYRVERAWVEGTFPFWKLRALLPGSTVRAVERAAGRWRPGLFGGQLLYVATLASVEVGPSSETAVEERATR